MSRVTAGGRKVRGFVTTSRLESPLIGIQPRRTALSLAFLGGFGVLFAVSHLATTVSVGGTHLETTSSLFDSLTALVIFLATAMIIVGPYLYAVWNGGPVLAGTIAFFPVVLGELATGRYALGLDGAIAITTAVGGIVLATYVLDVRKTASLRPWSSRTPSLESVLALSVVTLIGGVSVWQFILEGATLLGVTSMPLALLWMPPVTVVVAYWTGFLLARVQPTEDSQLGDQYSH